MLTASRQVGLSPAFGKYVLDQQNCDNMSQGLRQNAFLIPFSPVLAGLWPLFSEITFNPEYDQQMRPL